MLNKIAEFILGVLLAVMLAVGALYVTFGPEIRNIRWHLDNCDTSWVSNDTLMLTCNNGKVVIGSKLEISESMMQ